MVSDEQRTKAHIYPFIAFMVVMLVGEIASGAGLKHSHSDAAWYRQHPEYLMMLLQCVVCLPILIYWRKCYQWNVNKSWLLALFAGAVGIGFWILPTHLYTAMELGSTESVDPSWYKYFGLADRSEGFDAAVFKDQPWAYWVAIIARFFRAVVVVALVEEIFWRGFMMRYIIKPDGKYWKVKFGYASWKSWAIVTGAFMLVHAPVDWLGALIFGSLMYWLAIKSKSLFSCILMHGVANLLMGWYAFSLGKYGLW